MFPVPLPGFLPFFQCFISSNKSYWSQLTARQVSNEASQFLLL